MLSEMVALRELAAKRLQVGDETPWDWYQLMKLREALAALIESEEQLANQPRDERPTQKPEWLTVVSSSSPAEGG